jgi:ribulose-5-phosphate 4-epimerase/fuculose-1-phosphate aldolase
VDLDIKRNLSYAYRVLASLEMDDHTYTHLSARPHGANYYYTCPFGMLFSEVMPDDLLLVDLMNKGGNNSLESYNRTGYVIHSSVYANRSDVNAVFHLHTHASVAVSATKNGLLPISQWALHFYNRISYHNYGSLSLDEHVNGVDIVRDLGQNYAMLMRNHGMMTCGKTIHEAMFYCHHLENACKAQCMALSHGSDQLLIPSPTICEKAVYDLMNFEQDIGLRDWKAWIRLLPA